MSESQPSERPEPGDGEKIPDLTPKQKEQLAELVYRLMRDQVILDQERSGQRPIRRY